MERATALAPDDTPLARGRSTHSAVARPQPRRGWMFLALQAVLYYMLMGVLVNYYVGRSPGLPSGVPSVLKPFTNAFYRWRTGADAQGWLPCDGRCDWGMQRRFVNGREQTRRCYASGFVTADGECIMA